MAAGVAPCTVGPRIGGDHFQGFREITIVHPADRGQSIAVALGEAFTAQNGAGRFIDEGEAVGAAALGTRMSFAVQQLGGDAGNRGQESPANGPMLRLSRRRPTVSLIEAYCSSLPPFPAAACPDSQACNSAVGYNTVRRLPRPTRTQGTWPSWVNCHSRRGEMPSDFAASRPQSQGCLDRLRCHRRLLPLVVGRHLRPNTSKSLGGNLAR